jgi:DNA/RNA endonuclease YhcR with UshA esterase domain
MASPAKTLAADAPLTPVAGITKALVEHEVTVQAVISNIREPSGPHAPYNVSLTEGGATLPLIFWPDLQAQIASKLKVGNVVRVTALVSVYRDALQLRLRSAAALNVVTEGTGPATPAATAPTSTPAPAGQPSAPTETVIGAIKADWVDRVVTISGTIATSGSVDKTQRLTVQDATGEIQVVFGEKALAGLPVAQLVPGRVVTITGPVKLENGTRTIVPELASAVKLAPQ